ncbi:MAG: hypothetical protein ABI852_00190 [Gemmatimonadaceae bacterium]
MFNNVPNAASRLVRAGFLTGVVDGSFSSILAAFFYGSTVTKLFQGVAATVLGPSAADGGSRTAAIGWLMHFGVAFGWSAVFLLAYNQFAGLRGFVGSTTGKLVAAAVYGPIIWMVMSLVVIPLLLHRPTTITYKWWIQFVGHAPFVALPMIWMIAKSGE